MERFDISRIYGENVFNDESMRKYLPTNIYKQLRATIDQNKPLPIAWPTECGCGPWRREPPIIPIGSSP